VRAFKPGGPPAAEGPFRTLRRHEWVSAGVRISRHTGHGLAGQMTVFSSLNVASARLARRGYGPAAEKLARLAANLESGPEFTLLHRLLSDLPDEEAKQVVGGVLPEDAPAPLAEVLRALADQTGQIGQDGISLSSPMEILFAGQVAEVHQEYVVLVQAKGPATMVPRWMARAAHRDWVGGHLVLVSDKLDSATAVVEAVPAIDVMYLSETAPAVYIESPLHLNEFSPYGRGDARARSITAEDARLLAGEPRPLRILVPVMVEG
jgi:hypothetical protein